MFSAAAAVQLSLAVTSALTLASVGRLASSGLQPRVRPVVGTLVKVRVLAQSGPASACVTLMFSAAAAVQLSLAVTSALTLASVGRLASSGLQPRVRPVVGTLVIVGTIRSTFQV